MCSGFFCSKSSRALISSPADPQVGSYTVVYGFRVDQVRHEPADFFWRVELSGALPLSFGEFPQEILVSPTKNVRLSILQSEAMAADDLNQCRKAVVIECPLSALTLVVILDVQHAKEFGVELGDLAHGVGHELPQCAVRRVVPNGVPAVLVRDEEPDDRFAVVLQRVFVVGSYDLAGNILVAELPDLSRELVIEHIGQALEKHQRQDEILELGRVRRPTDRAGSVPKPRFECRDVQMLVGEGGQGNGRSLRLVSFLFARLSCCGLRGYSHSCNSNLKILWKMKRTIFGFEAVNWLFSPPILPVAVCEDTALAGAHARVSIFASLSCGRLALSSYRLKPYQTYRKDSLWGSSIATALSTSSVSSSVG